MLFRIAGPDHCYMRNSVLYVRMALSHELKRCVEVSEIQLRRYFDGNSRLGFSELLDRSCHELPRNTEPSAPCMHDDPAKTCITEGKLVGGQCPEVSREAAVEKAEKMARLEIPAINVTIGNALLDDEYLLS